MKKRKKRKIHFDKKENKEKFSVNKRKFDLKKGKSSKLVLKRKIKYKALIKERKKISK